MAGNERSGKARKRNKQLVTKSKNSKKGNKPKAASKKKTGKGGVTSKKGSKNTPKTTNNSRGNEKRAGAQRASAVVRKTNTTTKRKETGSLKKTNVSTVSGIRGQNAIRSISKPTKAQDVASGFAGYTVGSVGKLAVNTLGSAASGVVRATGQAIKDIQDPNLSTHRTAPKSQKRSTSRDYVGSKVTDTTKSVAGKIDKVTDKAKKPFEKIEEASLDTASSQFSGKKDHSVDIPIYTKKKEDEQKQAINNAYNKEQSAANRQIGSLIARAEAVNGFADDTEIQLEDGTITTWGKYKKRLYKSADLTKDKEAALKKVDASIKFSDKDVVKGGVKLASELAQYAIPYGATTGKSLKTAEKVLEKAGVMGAKQTAKVDAKVAKAIKDLKSKGASKEEMLKAINSITKRNAIKQNVAKEALANVGQDATIGTALDYAKGKAEGYSGKEMKSYMAKSAVSNLVLGGVMSGVAGRAGARELRAGLSQTGLDSANKALGDAVKLTRAEGKQLSFLIEKSKNGKLTAEETTRLKELKDKAVNQTLGVVNNKGKLTAQTTEDVASVLSGKELKEYITLQTKRSAGGLKTEDVGRLAELTDKVNNAYRVAETSATRAVKTLGKSADDITELQTAKAFFERSGNDGMVAKADKALKQATKANKDKQESLVKAVQSMSESTGVPYKVVSDAEMRNIVGDGLAEDEFARGYAYVNDKGETEILINSDSPQAHQTVIGHETGHLIKDANEDEFKALGELLTDYAQKNGDYEDIVKELAVSYKELDDEAFMEELTCEMLGRYIFGEDDTFIKRLAGEKPSILKRIIDYINGLYMSTAQKELRKELGEISDKVVKAYNEINPNAKISNKLSKGYHAGDLGKSEPRSDMSGMRQTGHFGTGTYFVGNKAKIEGYNMRDGKPAPVETVDFDKYNLAKPFSENDASDLHEFLREVNSNWRIVDSKVQDFDSFFQVRRDADNIYDEAIGNFDDSKPWGERLSKEDTEIAVGKYRKLYEEVGGKRIFDDILDDFNDNPKFDISTNGEYLIDELYGQAYYDDGKLYKLADEIRDFNDVDSLNFMKVKWILDREPEEIKKALNEVKEDMLSDKSPENVQDTASTRLMKKLGYEGVDVRHLKDKDNTDYGSVIYDLKGEDLARKKEIGTARFSKTKIGADGFYSKAEQVVNALGKNVKTTPESMIRHLKKKGVKDDELKWTGIYTFLDGKKNVTKQEMQDWIRANSLELEVVKHGLTDEADTFNRWGEYTLKKGDNYREYEYKLPKSDYSNDAMKTHWGDDASGVVMHSRIQDFSSFTPTKLQTGKYDVVEEEIIPYLHNVALNPQHDSPVGETIRFDLSENAYAETTIKNDFGLFSIDIVDAKTGEVLADYNGTATWRVPSLFDKAEKNLNGDKKRGDILFVEEIQSDWHNAGSEQGYGGAGIKAETYFGIRDDIKNYIKRVSNVDDKLAKEQADSISEHIASPYADEFDVFYERIDDLEEQAKKAGDTDAFEEFREKLTSNVFKYLKTEDPVPIAPYKKNYTDYAMKQALREAVDNGQDYVAWTTAKTQVERWSDKYAEGYRIEYDQEIPSFMKKYCGQWGAKVEKINLAENGEEVWAVKINDAMRSSIKENGQPRFSKQVMDTRSKEYKAKVDELAEAIAKGEDINTLTETAQKFVKDNAKIDREVTENIGTNLDALREAKKYMRETGIMLHTTAATEGKTVKQLLENVGYDTKQVKGKFRIKQNGGKTIERAYKDLQEIDAERFPDLDNEEDMLRKMLDVTQENVHGEKQVYTLTDADVEDVINNETVALMEKAYAKSKETPKAETVKPKKEPTADEIFEGAGESKTEYKEQNINEDKPNDFTDEEIKYIIDRSSRKWGEEDINQSAQNVITTGLRELGGIKQLRDEIKEGVKSRAFGKLKDMSNEEAEAQAANEVARDYDDTLRQYLEGDHVSDPALQMARAEALLGKIEDRLKINEGDTEAIADMMKIIEKFSSASTTSSAVMRSMKKLSTKTAKGRIGIAERDVKELNRRYKDRIKGTLELTEEEKIALAKATPEEADEIYKRITYRLWDNIPASWLEKFNEIRHCFMLLNPKTHNRNIVGNVTLKGIRYVANEIENGLQSKVFRRQIEKMGGEVDRVHVTHKEMTENKDVLTKAFHDIYGKSDSSSRNLETSRPSIEKMGDKRGLDVLKWVVSKEIDGVPAVKQKQLAWLIQMNYKALEVEDLMTGLMPTFKKSYMQYVKSKGWDINALTPAQHKMAGERAMFDAEYATFRDASKLSNLITGKKEKLANGGVAGKLGNIVIESVLPFVRTPINIARRSIDYSPVGLIRGVGKLATAKNVDVFKAGIKDMSSGLTGTGVFALGYFLASQSVLGINNPIYDKLHLNVRAGSESGDSYYDQEMGYQNYSLEVNINGEWKSLSLDWLSPAEVSLFMGAALNDFIESLNDGNSIYDDSIEILKSMIQPVLDMSFMSSSAEMMENFQERAQRNSKNGESDIYGAGLQLLAGDVPKSYVGAIVPQLIAQTAGATDKYQRDTRSTFENPILASWDTSLKQLANKVPVLREALLHPKLDRMGNNKLTSGDNIAERILNSYFNPATVKDITENKYDRELIKIRNSIEDKTSDDYQFFFYNFTGHPVYDLANGERMKYKDKLFYSGNNWSKNSALYQYGKSNRQYQWSMIKDMVDSDTYKVYTDQMKQNEVDGAHWVSTAKADLDTYGANYALKKIKEGNNWDKDSGVYRSYKNTSDKKGEKLNEAFVNYYVEKERLYEHCHPKGNSDSYIIKGLVAKMSGDDALFKAVDLHKDNAEAVNNYWKSVKKEAKGKKLKELVRKEASGFCSGIASGLEKADADWSFARGSMAAASLISKGLKQSERVYRLFGYDWNKAQAGAGLAYTYGLNGKKGVKAIKELDKMNDDLKNNYDVDGSGTVTKADVVAFIDAQGYKSTDKKACLFQALMPTANNPYASTIKDHLKWGKNTDSYSGGSGGGWGHGWGHGGGGGSSSSGSKAVTTPKGSKKKASHTSVSWNAPDSIKVTNPFATSGSTAKSNLDDAYRKKLKKLLKS